MRVPKGLLFLLSILMCTSLLVCEKDASPSAPQVPQVVGRWAAVMPGVYIAAMSDTADHRFVLTLLDNNQYDLFDSLSFRTLTNLNMNMKIEMGTWSGTSPSYTLFPTACADPATGVLSAAACTQSQRSALESGTTMTIVQFYMDVYDLVLTRL